MTEQEWLVSTDSAAMLNHMLKWPTGDVSGARNIHPHMPSDRKLRLYVAASARLAGYMQANEAFEIEDYQPSYPWPEVALNYSIEPKLAESRAALLREIVGNPYRPIRCRWCAGDGLASHEDDEAKCQVCGGTGGIPKRWLTPTVLSIAERIYAERDWEGMAGLSDALEDAGCDNAEILNHCRKVQVGRTIAEVLAAKKNAIHGGCCNKFADNSGCGCLETAMRNQVLHVRGCWVIDLLLGKS
jgi:hypothetical protein